MLIVSDAWFSFQDIGKAYKILQRGGIFVVGTYGLKIEKTPSGLMHASIVAFGKTMPNKTYFSTVTASVPPKKAKPVKKEKEVPKVVNSGKSTVGGLFG